MPTDDDRREVARRLRGLEVCELDGEFIDCGEVEGALGLVSDDGVWYEAEGVMRLADLIEQNPDNVRTVSGNIGTVSGIDRDALLALADEIEGYADGDGARFGRVIDRDRAKGYARRIRYACGVRDA